MPFDLQGQAGMGENDPGDLSQLFTGTRLERVTARIEEHIGHIDDQAPGAVASLQDRIELSEQLCAKLSLFRLGLRGSLTRSFGVCLRLLRFSFCFFPKLEGCLL